MNVKNHSIVPLSESNSNFFDRVVEVVKLIPSGRVSSYGAIAEYLGSKRGARMVGWAMNNCAKNDNNIPAHRVVNRIGLLTGKHNFSGVTMQERLEKEGHTIENDKVVNFEEVQWVPLIELL